MKIGDVFIHRYDTSRTEYMGVGYLYSIDFFYILKFSKLKYESQYSRKSMYNLELYTDIFQEAGDDDPTNTS